MILEQMKSMKAQKELYIYIKTLFFLENMQLNEIISFIKISKCFYFICFLHI